MKPFDQLESKLTFLISHRKELEKKYLDLSDKFFYLIQLTTEGIIMEDDLGYIYYCNKRLAKILGYNDESELIGLKFSNLFCEKDEATHYQNEVNVRKMKVSYSYKLALRAKNGERKDCRLTASVMMNSTGDVIGYYGTIIDVSGVSTISDHQMQMLQLRNLIVENTLNPTVVLDENDFVVDANYSFINYAGKNRSDVLQNSFENVIKGLEIENTYFPGIDEYEFYDPAQNQWYFMTVRRMRYNHKDYKVIAFFIIGHLKNQLQYHKLIFDDFRGFYFITNKKNQINYISPSFFKITHHTEGWFRSYYASLIQNKMLNLFEPITIITPNKLKLEFKLTQLYTNNESLVLFQATQK
jgi:PAS domain S-box-containing protein